MATQTDAKSSSTSPTSTSSSLAQPSVEPTMINIPVRCCTGEKFVLDVINTVSSQTLRELIAEKFKMHPSAMELTSCGHSTDSIDGISAVHSGCSVNVFPKSRTGLDTLPNLTIGRSSKRMKQQDLISLLSSFEEDATSSASSSSNSNGGKSTRPKVTIVLSGENGQVVETQLDISDAAKLIRVAGRAKLQKQDATRRKRHSKSKASGGGSGSSGGGSAAKTLKEPKSRLSAKQKGKLPLFETVALTHNKPNTNTTTNLFETVASTHNKPNTNTTTNNNNSSSSSSNNLNIFNNNNNNTDSGSSDGELECDPESADLFDVLSKFDDLATILPKEILDRMVTNRNKGLAKVKPDDTNSKTINNNSSSSSGVGEDDRSHQNWAKSSSQKPTMTEEEQAMQLRRQRATIEDELIKKGNEQYKRKMENLRMSRKLEMLRQKRDAKKAKFARMVTEHDATVKNAKLTTTTATPSNQATRGASLIANSSYTSTTPSSSSSAPSETLLQTFNTSVAASKSIKHRSSLSKTKAKTKTKTMTTPSSSSSSSSSASASLVSKNSKLIATKSSSKSVFAGMKRGFLG